MLYEKVATLCQNNNLTIAKLERECEMGNGTVRGWKNSSPSIENLKKVADRRAWDLSLNNRQIKQFTFIRE